MTLRPLPLAFAIFLGLCWTALSHDNWINKNGLRDPISGHYCCNAMDCRAVPKDGLRETGGGYLIVESGETIPYNRIVWRSPDGTWWRCQYGASQWSGTFMGGTTRCLIGPPPGS